MRPLSDITELEAKRVEGLFFDLDDTFLDEGRLSQEAYASLFALRAAGLRLVALTGRPAAWASLIARMWPVEAAIAENGALVYFREGNGLRTQDSLSPEERVERRRKLEELVSFARGQMPGLMAADDVSGRISDFTFDIGEFYQLSECDIERAQNLARNAGARTTRSSIHLHYTFDRADKATGALNYLCSRGMDATSARGRFAFIGDSENDASAFAAFELSVGVRNLRGDFSLPPRYMTQATMSAGFCELASRLISLRASTLDPNDEEKEIEND